MSPNAEAPRTYLAYEELARDGVLRVVTRTDGDCYSRFSVLLGGVFRSAKIEGLVDRTTNEPRLGASDHKPLSMDLSGVGARMAVAYGF